MIWLSFLVIAPLLQLPNPTLGQDEREIIWTRSLSEALAKAASGNKLIIADMVTDWCGWCRLMETTTWTDPLMKRQANDYVFLRLNAENEKDGMALRKQFHIDGYPTIMLLNADGSEFDRFEGYFPAKQFLAGLKASIANPQSLGNLKAQESKNGDDLSFRFKLGQALFSRYAFRDAQLRFEMIVSQDPENKSNLADSALLMLALCQGSQNEFSASLATLERLRTSFPTSKKIPDAYLVTSEMLMRTGQRNQAKAKLQDFLRDYPNHRLAPTAKNLLSRIEQAIINDF
jgi:thiol-disulfide isomerase/thioredoxin